MRPVWQCENDPFCSKVLKKHWPKIPNYGDLITLTENELADADVLCGGFPCQPHSVAGSRVGINDSRWLWPYIFKLLNRKKFTYVLLENVPGLLTSNQGIAFGLVLEDLASCGYDVEWEVISARVFGAPHQRKRLFIIAYPKSTGSLRCALFKDTKLTPISSSSTQFGNRNIYCGGQWRNPEYLRMVNGVSSKLVRPRIKAVGNSAIPIVGEYLGYLIQNFDICYRTIAPAHSAVDTTHK